jgi:protein transport protein SEC24
MNDATLLDNGEVMIIWVGSSAAPQLLTDLFGIDDIMNINPYLVSPKSFIPLLPTTLERETSFPI